MLVVCVWVVCVWVVRGDEEGVAEITMLKRFFLHCSFCLNGMTITAVDKSISQPQEPFMQKTMSYGATQLAHSVSYMLFV